MSHASFAPRTAIEQVEEGLAPVPECRPGWCEVMPRPGHPKTDIAARAAIQETPPRGTPGGFAPI
jgi:hypothetical protein